jgi:antitoxin (DNA-binding transcriptional repressor) of toxin-antitoxin stability system
MTTISIEEAQAKLPDLIHRLHSGDEVVITENDQPVALLVPSPSELIRQPRQPGLLKDRSCTWLPTSTRPCNLKLQLAIYTNTTYHADS